MKRSELKMKVKIFRESIEDASQTLPDEKAQTNIALYPHWGYNTYYDINYRVQYNDAVYKCIQAHDSQPSWSPTDAPSLWAKVLNPTDEIPDWEQPDSTNAYMTGDKVRYTDGHVYESLIDNNIWSPDAYPQGWKLIE